MNWYSVEELRLIAKQNGWKEIDHQENIGMISFTRNEHERTNVYYTKGTIGTCVNHPRQGKTQLFRRRVDLKLLRKIFAKPRVHTPMGYKFRKDLK